MIFKPYDQILLLQRVSLFLKFSGTQEGVRSHILRVETHAELARWVRSLVLGTYEACADTQQVEII